MKIILASVLLLVSGATWAEAFPIASDLWAAPRSGEAIRTNPAIKRAIDLYLGRPHSRLRMHFNQRDESTAQAEELRGWLLALGIEAARIDLIEDSPNDVITLEVVESK